MPHPEQCVCRPFANHRASLVFCFSQTHHSHLSVSKKDATFGVMTSQVLNSKPYTLNPKTFGRVFVGLSGGVDSSVSAALLKKDGFDVTGVFIRVWQPDWILCTWKEDRLDAMRVCAKLGIPFVELNLEKEYKKEVVDYMIAEYKKGNTPNPDVMCNRYVKFGGFYEFARSSGADYVATGHYARVMEHGTWNTEHKTGDRRQKKKTGSYAPGSMLHVACDANKDQSYFLWQIRKEQLSHILFPVGGLEKPEVRRLAKKFGLITADKKDSQGLCFLGKIDMKDFLKRYISEKKGKVLNESGEIIGTHSGAVFLTLGERHGFTVNVESAAADGTNAENKLPYYVVSKDIKKNTIIVSNNPKSEMTIGSKKVFEIRDTNWLGEAPTIGKKYLARIRYRQPLQEVRFKIHDSRFMIHFASSQSGGAPGQSIVIYDGEICLGGGVIC